MTTTAKPVRRHKHAFVGQDQHGDACIYIVYIDNDGATGNFLSFDDLQKVADKINSMRVLGVQS